MKKNSKLKELFKSLYFYFPFKKEIFIALKTFWLPPYSVYKHLYFRGDFTLPVKNTKIIMHHYGYQYHVETECFWGGIENGWEKVSMNLWLKLTENADVVFDIGANTGVFSLVAKAVNPKSKVYAFEPLKSVYKKLALNVNMNKYDIHCAEFALSNFTGTAKVYPTNLDHVYSVTVNKNLFPEQQSFEQTIRVEQLADFIEKEQIAKIDLMKIDVETHEVEVLEGMRGYLSKYKPDMLIEIQTDEIGYAIQKLLNGLGYVYYNIDENSGVRRVESLAKSDYLNYLVCSAETATKMGLTK